MSCSQDRIDRLREKMRVSNIDVLYLRDLSTIKWATAFDGVFDDEDAHALIVSFEEVILHTDSRYAQAADDAAKRDHVITVDSSTVNHATLLTSFISEDSHTLLTTKTPQTRATSSQSDSSQAASSIVVGIESSIKLGEYRQLEQSFIDKNVAGVFRETKDFVVEIRSVKDAEEIRRLKFAQTITDAAFSYIITFIRPGMTEREVQIELEDYMTRHGAVGLAFSSIVAAGAQGASPHAIPGDAILEPGQTLVLDFGARALGYCSDMTRTLFLGEPPQQIREAYKALREANEQVESFLRPGVTGAEAQNIAESILASAGFAGMMSHSLGHGVGIDIHEEPVLASRNHRPLVTGNVVTVEPGIYRAHEFGMRLEDFGVITDTGFDVFTQSSHDMVII